jgi:hypothetical protein
MDDRSAVELMLVARQTGLEREGPCGSCGQHTVLNRGVFIGSYGKPRGAIESCGDCAPKAERLAKNIVALLPLEVAAMLTPD